MPERRFPPPWSIDELEACFVVIDSAGQKLAYVYFEEGAGADIGSEIIGARRGETDCGDELLRKT